MNLCSENVIILDNAETVNVPNYTGLAIWKNGCYAYLKEGRLHCDSGPAVVYNYGRNDFAWYINGTKYKTKEAWFENLTTEQKLNFLFNIE